MGNFFNLQSFIEVYSSEDSQLITSLVKLIDNKPVTNPKSDSSITEQELNDLASLVNSVLPYLSDPQKEGYLFNYHLEEGINEQFDILRFSHDEILNIELKSALPEDGYEGILNQLKRHHFILSNFDKNVITCTYVSNEECLYFFEGYPSDELTTISIEKLAELIPNDYILENQLLNADLTHLIISPYSEPERFKDHQYFLTSEQLKAVKDTLSSNKQKFSITGGPGTGKSLVLFDLAKKYTEMGKKVLIVFCAPMSPFEEYTIKETLSINFLHIKNLKQIHLEEHEVILVDEAQRLWTNQYSGLINLNEKIIVFSTDHKQTLHAAEKDLNVEQKLSENNEVQVISLKDKIRNDKALSSFIQKFLNLKARKVQPYEYKKVSVVYFNNKETALNYIKMKAEVEDYVSIELTPYRTKTTNQWRRKMINKDSKSVHETIGREYDKVMVPIDKYFYYNHDAKLSSEYAYHYPYIESDSIFQALTRTRRELMLIVIENPKLYEIIQKILTWKKDKDMKELLEEK